MCENPLRALPKMDVLLSHPILLAARERVPYALIRQAARNKLEEVRRDVLAGAAVPPVDTLAGEISEIAQSMGRPGLKRVINATGVVLHTNLGRAPLARQAVEAVCEAAEGYSSLEYDLDKACRGSRHSHVETLLCSLTGAEAAMAVNNNAAAVFLMLSALAAGKGVAVSRGELVEIGGAFRVPEIMAASGAILREVGTTNKTRRSDYERAILAGEAQALLKVHTSNYQIVGFTEDTPLSQLSELAAAHDVPLLCDVGSCVLSPASLPNLPAPSAAAALADGADVVCFSGDKLLSGPQAGIVLGKKQYIDAMKRHPLARVVRIDKLSLAALEATLLLLRDPESARETLPVLSMLNARSEDLHTRAERLAAGLREALGDDYTVSVLPCTGQVGGGSLPNAELPGFCAAITAGPGVPEGLEAAFRRHKVPILCRIHHGALLLDVRTLRAEDEGEILRAAEAVRGTSR